MMSNTTTADETTRQIERGARIVCAVPADTKVVLQMPRGNLELIYPRSLVLSATRRQLDKYVHVIKCKGLFPLFHYSCMLRGER